MALISYLFFRFLILLFKLIPFPVLYFISDGLYLLFFYVIRYRRTVIQKNIEICYPNESDQYHENLERRFYRNFIDIILEGIKGLGMDSQRLTNRYKLVNPESIDKYHNQNRGVLIYCQHYNNWEWGPLTLGLQSQHVLVGIVKKLHNPFIERFIKKGRDGNNSIMVWTHETGKYFSSTDLSDKAFVFMADQFPFGKERSVELDFMTSRTKFHLGTAHYACKYNLPVFNSEMRRIKRGHYEVEVQLMIENPNSISPIELTEMYKKHLEKLIQKSPESWLWSHKRFKDICSY